MVTDLKFRIWEVDCTIHVAKTNGADQLCRYGLCRVVVKLLALFKCVMGAMPGFDNLSDEKKT